MPLVTYNTFTHSNIFDKCIWNLAFNKVGLFLCFILLYYRWTPLLIYLLLWSRTLVESFNSRMCVTGCILMICLWTFDFPILLFITLTEAVRYVLIYLPKFLSNNLLPLLNGKHLDVETFLNKLFTLVKTFKVDSPLAFSNTMFNVYTLGYSYMLKDTTQPFSKNVRSFVIKMIKEWSEYPIWYHEHLFAFICTTHVLVVNFPMIKYYKNSIYESKPFECTICYSSVTHGFMYPCKHGFCLDCTFSWLARNSRCPMCRKNIKGE